METHNQGSHSNHVVDVREGDKPNGGQVMHEHDQEVLESNGSKGEAVGMPARQPNTPLAQQLRAFWFLAPMHVALKCF